MIISLHIYFIATTFMIEKQQVEKIQYSNSILTLQRPRVAGRQLMIYRIPRCLFLLPYCYIIINDSSESDGIISVISYTYKAQ